MIHEDISGPEARKKLHSVYSGRLLLDVYLLPELYWNIGGVIDHLFFFTGTDVIKVFANEHSATTSPLSPSHTPTFKSVQRALSIRPRADLRSA